MEKYLETFIRGKYRRCGKIYLTDLYGSVIDLDRIYYRWKIELKLKKFLYEIYKRRFLSKQEKYIKDFNLSLNYMSKESTNIAQIVYKPVCDWCHKEFIKNDARITTELKQYHKQCFIKNIKAIMNEIPDKNLIVENMDYNLEDINLIDV